MSLRDLFRIEKPTIEDKECEYLFSKLCNILGVNKGYKLTNVTPGLAILLKGKYKGTYFRDRRIFLMNPSIKNGIKTIHMDKNELQEILLKVMKEG